MSSGLYQIRDKDLDTTLDLTRLKPYGDTMNDGKVQTSFTLPVKDDDKGAAAAVLVAQKMGLADPNVALRQKLDENFTFYVVYGSLTHTINYNEIVVQTVTDEVMDMHETDNFLKERLGRKMVVPFYSCPYSNGNSWREVKPVDGDTIYAAHMESFQMRNEMCIRDRLSSLEGQFHQVGHFFGDGDRSVNIIFSIIDRFDQVAV